LRLSNQLFCVLPIDASVGDRNTVFQVCGVTASLLAPGLQVALQHHAHNLSITGRPLLQNVSEHNRLSAMILA
jgi:hypothetical protein